MADKSLNLGTIFTANTKAFEDGIGRMRKALGSLNSAYTKTGKEAKKGFTAVGGAVDKTNKSFDKGGKKALEYSKQIGKVTGAFKRTVAAMKVTASYGIAATAIFAVTNAFKAGIKEIVDYDQALKNLQAITRATDAEVTGMGETIKQVAETTKFSTGEVADGMVLLGQAGFSASEAMNAMQSVANLATGTLSNMTMVTDLLTTTIRAFNLDTIESSRVADVMANAINRSKLTIDKLRIAFNFVGAAAAQSGLSIEEISASMMLLANNGLRASTIGTGLRQVLARLLAPNRRLREEFQAQGIALDKINPKTVGYQNSMKELTKVLYDAETQTVDMGKAYQLFGLRGAQAVSILIKGFAGTGFQNMLDKTYEVGTASDMAGKQMEGLAVAFKNLMDRAKLLFVVMGEGGLTSALKYFVLVLKGATIAVAAFLKSGIGQLIISVGVLTGSVYLLSKALVFLATGAFALLTKEFIGANLAVRGLIYRFVVLYRTVGLTSAVVGTAGTVFSKLWNIVKANPFIAFAAVIGIIVGAVNHYIGRTQRAIDATMKMSQETINNMHALKVYGAAIEDINKKKERGEKVEEEYKAILQRLLETYDNLEGKIKLNSEAHEENVKVIRDELNKELDTLISQNTKLIGLYDKSANQARVFEGALVLVKNAWKATIKWVGLSSDKQKEYNATTYVAVKTYEKVTGWLAKLGIGSKKAAEEERKRSVVIEQTAIAMRENGKSIRVIIENLEEMGTKEEKIQKIVDAFKRQDIVVKNSAKTLEEVVPNIFKDMYEKLDVLRQADFLKAIKGMEAEIASAIKKHEELTGIARISADLEAAIKAKHLIKFTEDAYKEILIGEGVSRKKLENLEYYISKVEEIYDAEEGKADVRYINGLIAAKGNKEKLLELEETHTEEVKKAMETRNVSIEGIQKAHNDNVKREQAKVVDAMRKLHKKMADDLIDQLTSKYNELKSEVAKLMDDLKNLEQSYYDDMRDSAQKTMTDEQKWNDDRKEVHRLMNEAKETSDAELYEKARSLAKSLGREVVNENGKVVRSLEQTTTESEELMTASYEAQSLLIKKLATERTKEMKKIQEDIKKITELLDEYEKAIGTASEKELKLRMEKALQSIGAANNLISKFQTKWDALESKMITLTVKINDPSGSLGGTSGGGGDTGSTEAKRKGGFIERLARGRKLPGWGGGDKIKALLEAGEWVIKKEAVQKYGSSLFEALNNMTFNIEDLLGGAMKRMGGMIAQPAPVKYQSDGEVSAMNDRGIGNTYHITFAPQFMTGDEMAMRNMAPELKRVLEDLDHRWGN